MLHSATKALFGLDMETGALSGLDTKIGDEGGLDRTSGDKGDEGNEGELDVWLSSVDREGFLLSSGADSGALFRLGSRDSANSLFLLIFLFWAEVKEIVVIFKGLGS